MTSVSRLRAAAIVVAAVTALALPGAAVADDATADAVPTPARIDGDASPTTGVDDPFEDVNRVTSEFNVVFRKYLLDPFVDGYRFVTPGAVQTVVSNVASNLSEPVTVVSSVFQLDFENAGIAAQRFVINSAFAGLGAGDLASELGIAQRKEDLGQSLGAHGVDPGPHIVLPILGPSNLRDLAGTVALAFTNPLPLAASAGQGVATYADHQEALRELGWDALDRYAVERAAYEQHRRFLITNGQPDDAPEYPSFDDDDNGR